MFYLENYSIYADVITKGKATVYTKDITKENWEVHYNSILNILRDGVESDVVKYNFIEIIFDCGESVELTIPDYWYNLIMWYIIVTVGQRIQPKHLFFDEAITRRTIKKYIDKFFIDENLSKLPNMTLNNIIDDCMFRFGEIDEFSYYLANTINLEDFITLMNENPEFYNILHLNLENVPLDMVKQEGMKYTKRAVEIIKDSEHCLANFFKAGEGVNIKQFKEFAINIGTKPDGNGGVYPTIINKNFIAGGVNDTLSFYIESSTGRTAQIIVDGNVGSSGHFARLLGLNNSDSFIHPDPNYDCHTANYQILTIKDSNMLRKLENRYYRLNPNGMEYKITLDSDIIGKTIYLRSPMTCASAAHGHGICYKCYGDLAFVNEDINIGKMAAELISSVITQRMLSAKHLLEAVVRKMKWSEGFTDLFNIEFNIIKLETNMDLTGYKLQILTDDIELESEEDVEDSFNEYINKFKIISPDGQETEIFTSDLDNLYITYDLNKIIEDNYDENIITIDLNKLEDVPLFGLQICNNDLSRVLDKVTSILNKKPVTTSFNRHELLQALLESLNEGGLDVNSVHAEIILMNQIRSAEDILLMPDWEYPNEDYRILTLRGALENNPSVTVTLTYEYISKTLASPLTFKKTKPSYMDLFFMEQPQKFLKEGPTQAITRELDENGLEIAITKLNEK